MYKVISMEELSGINPFIKDAQTMAFIQDKLNEYFELGYIVRHVYDYDLYLLEQYEQYNLKVGMVE